MAYDPEEMRRRLELDPTDEGAFIGLERIYLDGGYHEELAELCEYRAGYGLEGRPAAELFLRAAELWFDHVGNGDRGVVAAMQALERDPTLREAADRLDAYHRERGDTAALMQLFETQIEALEAYDPGASTARQRAHYNQQLGEIWAQAYDRKDQAVFYFRRAFELDPTNVMALYCAREIYQELGNYETAAKLLDLEARAEPDIERRIALYRELAHARAERLGDIEGAVVALKRAHGLDVNNADVMGELALLLLRRAPLGGGDDDRVRAADLLFQIAVQAEPEAALGYCEAALDAWPEQDGALSLFEKIAHETGRLDLLADRYRRLIEPLADSPILPDIYRRAGALAIEVGDLDEAIGYYEGLAPLQDPADHEVLLDLYRRAGRTDDLAGALSSGPGEFGAEGELEPSFPDADAIPRLRELAELLRAEGRDDEAEARMLEILELEPGDPEATSYLERRYRARSDWTALFSLLYGAGQSHKLSTPARIVRLREAAGIAEDRLGDLNGAIEAYKLATILDPYDEELPAQLERLLVAAERWDDLIDRVEAAAARAETTDEKIELLRRIADIHWGRREDLEAAADTLRRVLELRPDDGAALEKLDELYLRASRWEELIAILERRENLTAIGKDKASLDLRIAAVYHERLEQPEDAFEACARALKHSPESQEALRRMEAIDTISGNWVRLIETLRYRADLAEGEQAAEYLARAAATAEKHLGDHELAASLWADVIAYVPDDVEALAARASCLERAGYWEEALESLEAVAEATDDDAVRLDVRKQIARVLEERGHEDEAIAAWRAVTEVAEDADALEALAHYYEARGDHAELVRTLHRLADAVEDPAQLVDVLLTEARVLAGPLDEPEEALAVLERVLTDVDRDNREALRQVRGIYLAGGDFEQAARAAEREVEVTPDVAAKTELLLTCASWYRSELGDPRRAIEANERVLELDPYRTDVIAALEELYIETQDWDRLLALTRARYKAATDDEQRRQLLLAGAQISEDQLEDGERAWGWYRELFDAFGHQPDVVELVEEAAYRLGLGKELVGIYGELTKRAQTDLEQAEWWKRLGQLYGETLDDPPRALESMLRGFALDPDDVDALTRIDDLAIKVRAHDRLARVYEALLERERDPARRVGLLRRAASVFLREGGEPSIAFDLLLEAHRTFPDDDEIFLELEDAAEASGRWEEMLAVYEARKDAAVGEGDRIDLLLRVAQIVQEHLRDHDRAFQMVLEAVQIDPDDEHVATRAMQVVDGLERTADMRSRGRYWMQLIRAYQQLIDACEEQPEQQVIYLEWIARIQQDYIQDGRAAFETRKQQTLVLPGHRASLAALERLAQRLNMWSDLSLHYKDALEVVLDRDAAIDLHRRRARVLTEELDRSGDAIEHYWQLIQIDPHDQEIRAELTRIYEQTERWNDLMLLLERELPYADDERQHDIYLEVAEIWESKLQNSYEALDAYRRVLKRWPGDKVAEAAIARLKSPARRSTDVGDDELAALGLLDDAEPPVFDDLLEPDEVIDAPREVEEAELLDDDDAVLIDPDSSIVEDVSDLVDPDSSIVEDISELIDPDSSMVEDVSDLVEDAVDRMASGSPAQSGLPDIEQELESEGAAASEPSGEPSPVPPQFGGANPDLAGGPFSGDPSPAPEDIESAISVAVESGDAGSSSPEPLEQGNLGTGSSPSDVPASEGVSDLLASTPGAVEELDELTVPGTQGASAAPSSGGETLDEITTPRDERPSVRPSRPPWSDGASDLFPRRAPSAPSPLVSAVEQMLGESADEEIGEDDIEEIFEEDVEEVFDEELEEVLEEDFEPMADEPKPPPRPSMPPPLPPKK